MKKKINITKRMFDALNANVALSQAEQEKAQRAQMVLQLAQQSASSSKAQLNNIIAAVALDSGECAENQQFSDVRTTQDDQGYWLVIEVPLEPAA